RVKGTKPTQLNRCTVEGTQSKRIKRQRTTATERDERSRLLVADCRFSRQLPTTANRSHATRIPFRCSCPQLGVPGSQEPEKKEPGISAGSFRSLSASSRPGHVDLVTAERSRNRQSVRRRI